VYVLCVSSKQQFEDNGIEFRCQSCDSFFLSESKLKSHVEKGGCIHKGHASEEKNKIRNIVSILSAMAQEAKEKKENVIKSLGSLQFKFKPGTDVGISLEMVEGRFVVKSVTDGSVAFRTSFVDEGFILVAVNGSPPTPLSCLDGPFDLQNDDGFVVLEFKRPTPPIPPRGYARRGFQKRPKFKMNKEQITWLESTYQSRNASGLRGKGYHDIMISKFQFRIRDDVDEPFWLFEPQINDWLKSKKAEVEAVKKANEVKLKEEAKQESKKQKSKGKAGGKDLPSKKKIKIVNPPSSSSSEEEEEESDFDDDDY